jgi:hypothetical protein
VFEGSPLFHLLPKFCHLSERVLLEFRFSYTYNLFPVTYPLSLTQYAEIVLQMFPTILVIIR